MLLMMAKELLSILNQTVLQSFVLELISIGNVMISPLDTTRDACEMRLKVSSTSHVLTNYYLKWFY